MADSVPHAYRVPINRARIELIAASHLRLLGVPLIAGCADLVAALWHAPQAIVAHGLEPDPLFFFGNRAALSAFETDPASFVGMPSHRSAEAPLREERQALLERVARDGFIDDYSGIRISARGKRFRIEGAVVWNLVDEVGVTHGQAAAFAC